MQNEVQMTKKTHKTNGKGKGKQEEWAWEESPETIEAVKRLHEAIKKVKTQGS